MVRKRRLRCWIPVFVVLLCNAIAFGQQAGSIRGTVYDKDFDVPLAAAQVSIAETGARVVSADEGSYVFGQVSPGTYTLVYSKDGYNRQIKSKVTVQPGQMTEVDISLTGDFTDMDEFVVQDIQFGTGSEENLLKLRIEAPALMDSISSDLMSQAGASDAAGALRLVSGATVQDGKYAVIRGLPDRYVNSQMNGVRLPTADQDKRAVQLDQFPSAVIDSIQVSKTFTPDQQGDASGGAVNVVLKGIPDETIVKFGGSSSYNTQVTGINDFLTYKGGGVNSLGTKNCDVPSDGQFDEPMGVTRGNAPPEYKWSGALGGKHEFGEGLKVGGFGSVFYERNTSFYNDGKDDKYWVEKPGGPMTPQYGQGSPDQGDFKTSLFDVTQGSEEVKWGGLGTVGVETKDHSLSLLYMYTHVAESIATLAEDTRGKAYYFPGYDPSDPKQDGNQQRDAAPYLRLETLEYTQRETQTLQLRGRDKLPVSEVQMGKYLKILAPELDWVLSYNTASLCEPDKRQFGSMWWADSYNPGYPPYLPPSTDPAAWMPFKPAANFTVGNLQRTWKDISEDSNQYSVNMKIPFEQWTKTPGYIKFGAFGDKVTRDYQQSSFSNFNDNTASFAGGWDDYWSEHFPSENHPMVAGDIDVNYTGNQDINALYYMIDLPVTSFLKFIGGTRFEDTKLGIVNTPEKDVTWLPPGAPGAVKLNPGDADVAFEQKDVLPSIGFELKPLKKVTLRGSYSETVARQTFKELSPIQQQEFLGSDVFIGNPSLQMSALKNYDLRLDYTPYDGGLMSVSVFKKDITNPIEYVQRIVDFPYTTPVNYPKGELSGYEVEFRQDIGKLWEKAKGLSVGTNATFINSQVTLPKDEAAQFDEPNINTPTQTRDMTNTPDHLYNAFLTYDLEKFGLSGTELSAFYSVKGDTLVAGAGQSKGKYVPDVYEKEYGTLNLGISQKLGEHWNIRLQAKNVLNPDIQTVYRSKYIDKDVVKTSHTNGVEFSLGISGEF